MCREHQKRIIGYCAYCKDEVLQGEEYYNDKGELLHKEVCADQSETYYDSTGDEEEVIERDDDGHYSPMDDADEFWYPEPEEDYYEDEDDI